MTERRRLRVHRVVAEHGLQRLIPSDMRDSPLEARLYDGRPRRGTWTARHAYVHDPLAPETDFPYLIAGALAMTQRAADALRPFLERAGELFPLVVEGCHPTYVPAPHVVLNVTECVNCLDHAATRWKTRGPERTRIGIQEHEFHPERLPGSSLFKIPETARGEILCLSGRANPADELMAEVLRRGLKGLGSELIWEQI